jgi:uncharacterized protein (DUF1810 family)
MELRSCATLFAFVSPPGSVFWQLLDAFFGGVGDSAARWRLERADAACLGAVPRE